MKYRASLLCLWNPLCFFLLAFVSLSIASGALSAQEVEARKVTFCIYLLNDTSSLYNEVQSMGSVEYAPAPVSGDSPAIEGELGSAQKQNISEQVVTYVAPRFKYMQNGELKTITVSHGGRSDFYDYEGVMPIELYEEFSENGAVQLKRAGTIHILESQDRALVVLGGVKKGEYKAVTIGISHTLNADSSMEDSRIYNLTDLELAIRTGSLTKVLEPNGNTKVNSVDFNSSYLPIRLGIRINDKWRRRYSASLFLAENAPQFFLIYQPQDLEGSLEIVTVSLQ